MTAKRRHRHYPKSVRELVDCDYVGSLSDSEFAFLDKFIEEFYGASRGENPLHDEVQLKELYKTKNHRNSDLFTQGFRTGGSESAYAGTSGVPEHIPDGDRDWSSSADYLDSPEYQNALSEFRAELPSDGRENTRLTPRFRALTQKLASLSGVKTREGEEGLVALQNQNLKTRRERLEKTQRIVKNIGTTVANHTFEGKLCVEVVEMLTWLHDFDLKLQSKIASLIEKTVPEGGTGGSGSGNNGSASGDDDE